MVIAPCSVATSGGVAATVAIFLMGASLFGYGLHKIYGNVEVHRARVKARSDFVREKLRKKYGYGSSSTK